MTKTTTIPLATRVGPFAGNKDTAREIRLQQILPALERGERVVLDFSGIGSATQSFVHALISDVIRKKGVDVLDRVDFKNCNEVVQKVIQIVVEYMQDATSTKRA